MRFRNTNIFALLLAAAISVAIPVWAQSGQEEPAPVAFAADRMQHDDKTGIVTASGNVEIEQEDRILRADKVVYDIRTDTVKAVGNVSLMEPNGDVHFADEVEFTDKMRDGYVQHLRSTLKDGSRFWAASGKREQGTTTTMAEAGYTPCESCPGKPDAAPPWQLRAREVRHEKDEHRVTYRDATMELWGMPVLYTPYFAHPDGTVKQKSGFMTPDGGYKSDLGLMLTNSYYYALSPYYDATMGVTVMSNQAPLLFGEYRRRFTDAELTLDGSITHSSYTDDEAGQAVKQDEELRGHIFANGLWDINEKWRAGTKIEFASDDQYMRQYDFSNKDVLENEIYTERFSGRNYSVGRLLSFQDIRVREEQTDQPDVLPEVLVSMLGQPGKTLGGRWSLDLSALGLRREAGGQDMNRVVAQTGWERRLVSDTGLLTTVDLKLRGDGYSVGDRDVAPAGSGRSGDSSAARGFAQAHVVTSYPLIKPMRDADMVIEPIAAITVAPDIEAESDDFPNEDSQDVQVDALNIFDADRFPGYDRIEDESHVTYGVRTGLYGHEGSKGEVFLGQSYRFEDDPDLFPAGSGLSGDYSDVVGQVTASYRQRYNLDYRFQLDSDSYGSHRHEVTAGADFGKVQMAARYLYANALGGTTLTESREQVQASVAYSLTDNWRVRTAALHDLGEDPGLRRADLGVDYIGQCFNFSATARRNLTHDSSGDSGTEVMFRVGLKNIGEFQTSGINLTNSRNDEEDNDQEILPPVTP